MGFYKIFHPAIFQGSLKKKNYFEGWFLKHVTSDGGTVLSIIPGIALNPTDSHAFIQIMDGNDMMAFQVGDDARFIPELIEKVRVGRQLGMEHLQRHFALQGGVGGAVNGAETAASDLFMQFVFAECCHCFPQ